MVNGIWRPGLWDMEIWSQGLWDDERGLIPRMELGGVAHAGSDAIRDACRIDRARTSEIHAGAC